MNAIDWDKDSAVGLLLRVIKEGSLGTNFNQLVRITGDAYCPQNSIQIESGSGHVHRS